MCSHVHSGTQPKVDNKLFQKRQYSPSSEREQTKRVISRQQEREQVETVVSEQRERTVRDSN